jgi:hypothetical protein
VVSAKEADPVHIQLADFGLARKVDLSSIYAYDLIQWIAPEALSSGNYLIIDN